MSAQRISEREWAKGAQSQAEEWYTAAIEAAKAHVKSTHDAWEQSLVDLGDLIERRAEMRESFARIWVDGA